MLEQKRKEEIMRKIADLPSEMVKEKKQELL